jgi:hypothetical protein
MGLLEEPRRHASVESDGTLRDRAAKSGYQYFCFLISIVVDPLFVVDRGDDGLYR